MRPIYILERYDDSAVRRQRATLEEIRAVVDGKSSERLAYVAIGDDGDIIATPLTEQDLAAIGSELSVEHERRIRQLLDDAAKLARTVRGLRGVSAGSFGAVTFWLDECAPGTDDLVLAWADAHGAEIKRGTPPTKPRKWRPDAEIKVDDAEVCRLVWPEREAFDDEAVAEEIEHVAADRAHSDAELAELARLAEAF